MNKDECMEFLSKQCGDLERGCGPDAGAGCDPGPGSASRGPELCREFMEFQACKQATTAAEVDCGACAVHCPCCS